jgi:hypothetical protein
MTKYEDNYDNFWKAIVEDKNGVLNIDQMKRELSDYYELIKQIQAAFKPIDLGKEAEAFLKDLDT